MSKGERNGETKKYWLYKALGGGWASMVPNEKK
jgi:hypothetical protein